MIPDGDLDPTMTLSLNEWLRVWAQAVACPYCGVAAGERCRQYNGALTAQPHAKRRSAREAAGR